MLVLYRPKHYRNNTIFYWTVHKTCYTRYRLIDFRILGSLMSYSALREIHIVVRLISYYLNWLRLIMFFGKKTENIKECSTSMQLNMKLLVSKFLHCILYVIYVLYSRLYTVWYRTCSCLPSRQNVTLNLNNNNWSH